MRKYFEMSENENTVYQNPWDTVKAVSAGRCIAVNACIKNQTELEVDSL